MTYIFLLASAIGAATSAVDCEHLLLDTKPTALALDYQAFDQTPGQGFRVLAEAGCPRQAADLIEEYIDLTSATQRSLRWHVAQLRGESGHIDAARAAAVASLSKDETPDATFRWNAHVQAYLAFLDGNRSAFDAALAELDGHAEVHRGNAMNAGFWRRLEPYFELGYPGAVRASMAHR